jgi:Anti-sigma-K factor rskA, C-terminal
MSAMDHAAAHERIEDLVLEPTRLAALPESVEPADIALRDHLAGCTACRTDLEGWQQLQRSLSAALPASAEAATIAVDPIDLPPSLRATVAGTARASDVASTAASMVSPGRPRLLVAWLGAAAAMVALVAAGLFAFDQVNHRVDAESDARALASALAAVDRVLAAPEHRVAQLRDSAGLASGSISWSGSDLVVLTTALAEPPADRQYLCWLMEPEGGAVIGRMYFAGRTAYWIGSLDEWATFRIGPDTRFLVTLQERTAEDIVGQVVLSADLGG